MVPPYKPLIRRADWNAAYDAAMSCIAKAPDDTQAQHAAVLCLVRAGSLEQAQKLYTEFELESQSDDEDIVSLGARILKGLMLEAKGEERLTLGRAAQAQYLRAFQINQGPYPGINTATLALLNADTAQAEHLAQQVLALLKQGRLPSEPQDVYYHHATQAEAQILLKDFDAGFAALDAAIAADPENYAVRAVTIKQLELIIPKSNTSALQALDARRPYGVIHFTGHIYSHEPDGKHRHLSLQDEPHLIENIDNMLARYGVCEAYGALAAGGDILIAEATLRRGGKLHVVLPTNIDSFANTSVTPLGSDWDARFHACLKQAESLKIIDPNRDNFDDLSFANASHFAMGLASLRSKALASHVYQLAIWDKGPMNNAGTSHDCNVWTRAERPSLVIAWPGSAVPRRVASPALHSQFQRKTKSMLFTDIVGYGRLPDKILPELVRTVFTPLAKMCRDLPQPPDMIDTWGDGIFLTFDTVDAAAFAAIKLQAEFRRIVETMDSTISQLALRIGGHCGPVYLGNDPFRQNMNVYGRNVVIASRIEPLTLPGAVYVSEPFACMLDASYPEHFQCEYIGALQSRKERLPLPLFSLRRGPRQGLS